MLQFKHPIHLQYCSNFLKLYRLLFLSALLIILPLNKLFSHDLDTMKLVSFNNCLKEKLSLDSSLDNFHNQIPFQQEFGFASSGTIVLPQRKLIFDPLDYSGFRLMDNVYQLFEFEPKSTLFYSAAKPLTDMGFGVGSKKESYFSFLHTQNFGKYLNFTSSLRTSRTEAFYNNQIPHHINFNFNFNYHSKNKKYLVILNTTINTIFHKENGGVLYSNLFDIRGERLNPQIVETNLNKALFKKNSSNICLKQFYNFSPIQDTNATDFTLNQFGKKHLFHSLEFSENRMRFIDSLENFQLNNINFDTSKIKQFLYHQNIDNTIGFEQLISRESKTKTGYEIGIKHSYNYVSQPALRSNFNNVWMFANFSTDINLNYHFSAYFNQSIAGFNKGDYNFNTSINNTKLMLNQVFKIGLKFTNQLSEATFIQKNYYNDLFKWKNDLKKISITQLEIFANGEKTSFNASFNQISNFVYFDTIAKPMQSVNAAQLIKAEISHPLKLNKLHINSRILYQKNLANFDLLRLPEFSISEQIYFEGFLFKHALFSQAGLELNYSSNYYGNSYMPLLNQFYLQDKLLVGGYPQVDVFFNFKIQQVRVFFKISNVNNGLYPLNIYYQTPNYPMYNRMFRLGVIWRFWD